MIAEDRIKPQARRNVFLLISTHISLVLIFPGSAETDIGWGENLNCHLMATPVVPETSGMFVPKIIKIW